jgi:inner membrane protein
VNALPRPVSPFNWMIIVSEQERYHYAFVNLARSRALEAVANAGMIRQLDAHYLPVSQLRWQTVLRFAGGEDAALGRQVWQQAAFGFFRWFAAYPVVAEIERRNPSTCVWFRDLRFLTPGRDAWPFRYGMCRDSDGAWQAYEYPEGAVPVQVSERQ